MAFDSIIFDLDGTLWNATPASATGWTRGLEAVGIDRVVRPEEIASVAGLPFAECVRRLFPDASAAVQARLVSVFGDHERLAVESSGGALYPGVAEGLRMLAAKRPLFVVSNCQEWYLDLFLRCSGVGTFFTDCECHGRTGQPKGVNIRTVAERNGLVRPVYVGDTLGDQEAARQAGIAFVHAAYGFGRMQADRAVASFPELVALFG